MRWSLLLLLVGCGSPQVRDIVFPAVAVDADGAVRGYMDVRSLTTTNRQAIGKYSGLRVIDANGREFVIEAVKEIDPPGVLSDFAGTKPFQVEITLGRGRRMAPSAAVPLIARAVRGKLGYLDLTEQGGQVVADEIASKATVAEVAELLAEIRTASRGRGVERARESTRRRAGKTRRMMMASVYRPTRRGSNENARGSEMSILLKSLWRGLSR